MVNAAVFERIIVIMGMNVKRDILIVKREDKMNAK